MQDYTIDMGFDEFEKREELRWSLGYAVAQGLWHSGGNVIFIDYTGGEKQYTGRQVLAAALGLAKEIAKQTQKPRVGIVLPPSFAAAALNYACIFANKTPVNLNFTMGATAAQSCIENAGIDTILTLAPVKEKIGEANPKFPWTKNVADMLPVFANPALAENISGLSPGEICEKYGIEKYGGSQKEGTLIFTSGSEGAPKAAILSQRNIIANSVQTKISEVFNDGDILLGNLPVFHSFGLLFEVWHAAIAGLKTLMVASPIDIKTNLKAIKEYRPSVMIGSPTFYRAYLKYANSGDLQSLGRVIAGAEKTPHGFHDAWDKAFGCDSYKEGYGLTEATPVVGVNLPDKDFGRYSTGTRRGSIGKLFPGMQARILDPITHAVLPFGRQGLLSLRGANIFPGYLNDKEASKAVLQKGWLVTGDLSRLDADGFVYVDGRLSRFSKIGGEMVPHATVETALAKAMNLDGADTPVLCISSRLDEDKGEALVLISGIDIELHCVKEKLREAGISNLWMPKYIVRAQKIPLLPSGKLDLKALQDLARG